MGYWDHTIEGLDRLIDSTERIAVTLAQSEHKREAADLRAMKAGIAEVRNDLLCRQHDLDRGADHG